MPRGFKKAIPETELAYLQGRLIDSRRRSFISQPKAIPGECDEPRPHLILFGADRTAARMKLFLRKRSTCQKCGRTVAWGGDDPADYFVGEMQHIRDKAGQKCDCEANLTLACHNCHQGPGSAHFKRRPRWTAQEKIAAAVSHSR